MLYVIGYIWANINDKYKLSSYTTNIRYCTILVFLTSYFLKKNPIAFSKYVQKSSASATKRVFALAYISAKNFYATFAVNKLRVFNWNLFILFIDALMLFATSLCSQPARR